MLTLVLLVAVLAAGCSSNAPASQPGTTPSSSAPTAEIAATTGGGLSTSQAVATPETGSGGQLPTTAPPASGQEYAVGDTAEIGDYRLTVNQVVEIVPPSGNPQPFEGSRFVGVDVTLENTGSEDLVFSSFSMLSLTDDTAATYSAAAGASASIEQPLVSGVIAPGQPVRGTVGFEVPEDVKDVVLMFTPTMGRDQVTFRLNLP
jgi:hypothetical protein